MPVAEQAADLGQGHITTALPSEVARWTHKSQSSPPRRIIPSHTGQVVRAIRAARRRYSPSDPGHEELGSRGLWSPRRQRRHHNRAPAPPPTRTIPATSTVRKAKGFPRTSEVARECPVGARLSGTRGVP